MARTVFAMITLLDDRDAVDPGFGNRPGGARPDQGLPAQPGHPSQPIFHPGHPDHGLPSGGHIGNQLPWSPGSPDNSLPVPPGVSPPQTPANLKEKLVVLWRLPNTTEWHGKAMDPSLSAGYPLPETPEPKA